jgi:anti-anti-sigma factor
MIYSLFREGIRGRSMKIITQVKSTHTLLKVEGSLSNENLQELENHVSEALDKRLHIVLDINEVSFICSAALGLLLEYNKKSQTRRQQFILCGARDDIKKLFVLTELNKHLSMFESYNDASRHLEAT